MAESIEIRTRSRNELVEITREVQAVVTRLGVAEGICFVFVPHTTAGICINENADPDVRRDVARFLERLIPQDASFAHAEENSDIQFWILDFGLWIVGLRGSTALNR